MIALQRFEACLQRPLADICVQTMLHREAQEPFRQDCRDAECLEQILCVCRSPGG